MFGGIGKEYSGLRVSFFINLKVASNEFHQVTLLHTTNVSTNSMNI